MFPPPADPRTPAEIHPPGSYELVATTQLFVGTVSLMMPAKSAEQDEELLASIQVDGVIEAIHVTPRAPNREGIVRHRIDNGRHRLEAARRLGIEALWVKWNDPAWSRDELIRKMLAVESKGRVWDVETRHELIVKLNEEEHRSVRQIVALTGWSLGSVQRALHFGELDTGPGRPGEHPEVGSPRYLEMVRQATDPDVSEDRRFWAIGDGATAMKSPQDQRMTGAWLDEHNARTADLRQYLADVGFGDAFGRAAPFWRTSAAWPHEDRVRGASWSDHERLNHREDRKERLKAEMRGDAAELEPADEIHQCISQARALVSDALDVAWAENQDGLLTDYEARHMQYCIEIQQGLLARLQAYLDGGREGYWTYDEEHPQPADMYSAEYGEPIPATDKYAMARAARPGPVVGGDGQVPR